MMGPNLLPFEANANFGDQKTEREMTDQEINEKYQKGEARIVTEQGAIKLELLRGVFTSDKYTLRPEYQRRITWDTKKRSKLIESFIMNVPVPPVFLYETDYSKYQVMDGLQRISAIMDFYDNRYALEDLKEWKELNGRTYTTLPQNIKEGIDRRQITVITLLKESTKDNLQEENMKKMVFERLNTGGVKLVDQEIRNALYPGKFNKLCIKLSENRCFKTLWNIPAVSPAELVDDEIEQEGIFDDQDADKLRKNELYKRMYDVELVLRFFSMRYIEKFNMPLSAFFDKCLINGNKFTDENIEELEAVFNRTIKNAYVLFGDKAFCQWKKFRGAFKWSSPQKMIYDPMMIALSASDELKDGGYDVDENCKMLERQYEEAESKNLFDGKKQSKSNILERADFFNEIIKTIVSRS